MRNFFSVVYFFFYFLKMRFSNLSDIEDDSSDRVDAEYIIYITHPMSIFIWLVFLLLLCFALTVLCHGSPRE